MEEKSLAEVEGLENNPQEQKTYSFSGLKVIGGIHLVLGVVSAALGLINVITFVITDDTPDFTDDGQKAKKELATNFAITSTGVWCGIWFCLCGAVALNINLQNRASNYCFKITFLVLSILCATLFGPATFVISGYEAYLRHEQYTSSDYKWLVPLLTAFFAFNEIIISVVSAILCCILPSFKQSKVMVLIHEGSNQQQTKALTKSPTRQSRTSSRPVNPHLNKHNGELVEDDKLSRVENDGLAPLFRPHPKKKLKRQFTIADHIHNDIELLK